MPSMRMVYDNLAADATVTVASVGGFVEGNLKTDSKDEVWRNGVTTASITVAFTVDKVVNFVGVLNSNLSPTATATVKYLNNLDAIITSTSVPVFTGGAASRVKGLTNAQSASAYGYGGGKFGVAYTAPTLCRKVVIDISDPSNAQGYLEAANLVVGEYWSPTYDASVGGSISLEDTSESVRSGSGNLVTDLGTRFKNLEVDLSTLTAEDRANLWKIVAYSGVAYPVFVSLYPGSADKDLEQHYSVYGKFSRISRIMGKSYNVFSAPLEIIGI